MCILRACCLKYMARQTHTSSPFYSSQLCYSYLDVPTFLQTWELVIIDILDMAPSKATSESCDPFWFLKERCQVSDEHMCRKNQQLCVCGLKAVYKSICLVLSPLETEVLQDQSELARCRHHMGVINSPHGHLQTAYSGTNIFFTGFLRVTTVFLTGSPRVRKNIFLKTRFL